MNRSALSATAIGAAVILGGAALTLAGVHEEYMRWEVHDMDRPLPEVVTPGNPSTQEQVGSAPSDAVVLFGAGSDLSAFTNAKGEPAAWDVFDDYFVVKKGAGPLVTKQSFGDMQLHIEWMIPGVEANRTGQNRGNSGIFIMKKYELQVLDNLGNDTYADGMAGSIYGQRPPMVNAGLGLDQWQTYDVIFRRPHFDDEGNLTKPATITVLHNGVLVQDHTEILGPTRHKRRTEYSAHEDALPFTLQDHNEPTHYRNIWVRELPAVD